MIFLSGLFIGIFIGGLAGCALTFCYVMDKESEATEGL